MTGQRPKPYQRHIDSSVSRWIPNPLSHSIHLPRASAFLPGPRGRSFRTRASLRPFQRAECWEICGLCLGLDIPTGRRRGTTMAHTDSDTSRCRARLMRTWWYDVQYWGNLSVRYLDMPTLYGLREPIPPRSPIYSRYCRATDVNRRVVIQSCPSEAFLEVKRRRRQPSNVEYAYPFDWWPILDPIFR